NAAEPASVCHTDHQDHGYVRLDESSKMRDATRRCGTELADKVTSALCNAQHCDGRADLIVVRVNRGDGLPLVRKNPREEVLRRGLAVRAGDPDDLQLTVRAHSCDNRLREISKSCHSIRNNDL